ncbi:hypothetical protein Goari_003639 [Gossypium aridum]|uniref:Uncharacterized protein n=1 Tax=Gossypium aridum TaxID=34290 RepID=A0A7J8YCY7_GOSAI|nr:hypothetical protein [Gossypium aridum]
MLEEIFDELDLPELREWRYWGSPFGWLVTHDLNVKFVIFKLDMDTKSWEKIYSLGDSHCCRR